MTRLIRPTGHGRRRRLIAAIVFVTALVVSASVVALGRAGSVRTTFTVDVLPHVLTLNSQSQGFFTTHFTNGGPSTVNHVFETIDVNLPPANVTAPTGCSTPVATQTGSEITCIIGQFPPGSLQELGQFTVPTSFSGSAVTVMAAVTFDEAKGTGLTDTQTASDSSALASTTDPTRKGQCLPGQGDSLSASNGNQQTFLSYPGLPVTFVPCTPGDSGVNSGNPGNVSGEFGDTSFVEFLAGNGLATVQITIFNPPKKVTKNTLAFVEYPNYPNDLTPTNGGNPVPSCVTINGALTIPPTSGYVSCVVSIVNNPGGGLLATLLAQGGSDSGWGHTG